MTEKNENKKRLVWEPIDEQEVEEDKKWYAETITFAKTRFQEYKEKEAITDNENAPSMKAHFALLQMVYSQRVDTLLNFLRFEEVIFAIYKQTGEALVSLEKQIDEISEKTHVDLSQIKNEVAQVREKVDEPMYKFLKEQKEAEGKIRKQGEDSIDNLTRSH